MAHYDAIFKHGTLVNHDGVHEADIGVTGERIAALGDLSADSAGHVIDCKGLSYAGCVEKLSESGFGKFTEQKTESTPEQKDKVLATIPPANQTAAITNPITIVAVLPMPASRMARWAL